MLRLLNALSTFLAYAHMTTRHYYSIRFSWQTYCALFISICCFPVDINCFTLYMLILIQTINVLNFKRQSFHNYNLLHTFYPWNFVFMVFQKYTVVNKCIFLSIFFIIYWNYDGYFIIINLEQLKTLNLWYFKTYYSKIYNLFQSWLYLYGMSESIFLRRIKHHRSI